MLRDIPKLEATVVTVLLVAGFLYVPLVPYFQPVSVPGSFAPGIDACLAGVSQTNVTEAAAERLRCQDQFRSPPVYLLSFAPAAYTLLAYGPPPFPSQELVTLGNHSAVVFFDGGRAVAVEDAGPPGVLVNPHQVLYFQTASVVSSDYGFLNITLRLRNLGLNPITHSSVYLSMEGYSTNKSIVGLALVQPKFVGSCSESLAPADYCAVSEIVPNNLPVNQSFSFYPEVRGSVQGKAFIYRQGFGEDYPRGGVGPLWVKEFMAQVNRERAGPSLVENSTLDSFAAIRFKNASAVYQISDWGLPQDAVAFFGASQASSVSEELLFPGIFSPDTYPTFLANYAMGHWGALDNPVYRQFGYYVGVGSYYTVSVPCSVYEIPRAGVNITQFFGQFGCTTLVSPSVWLVVIMTP